MEMNLNCNYNPNLSFEEEEAEYPPVCFSHKYFPNSLNSFRKKKRGRKASNLDRLSKIREEEKTTSSSNSEIGEVEESTLDSCLLIPKWGAGDFYDPNMTYKEMISVSMGSSGREKKRRKPQTEGEAESTWGEGTGTGTGMSTHHMQNSAIDANCSLGESMTNGMDNMTNMTNSMNNMREEINQMGNRSERAGYPIYMHNGGYNHIYAQQPTTNYIYHSTQPPMHSPSNTSEIYHPNIPPNYSPSLPHTNIPQIYPSRDYMGVPPLPFNIYYDPNQSYAKDQGAEYTPYNPQNMQNLYNLQNSHNNEEIRGENKMHKGRLNSEYNPNDTITELQGYQLGTYISSLEDIQEEKIKEHIYNPNANNHQ